MKTKYNFIFENISDGLLSVRTESKTNSFCPLFVVYKRAYINDINTGTRQAGSYILFDLEVIDEKWKIYIGESTNGGVANRIITHTNKPPKGMENWKYALVIYGYIDKNGKNKNITYEEAHILESEFCDYLEDLQAISLQNKTDPDISTTKKQRKKANLFIEPTIELLRFFGINPKKKPKIFKTFKEHTEPEFKSIPKTNSNINKKKIHHNVKLIDLVNSNCLNIGQELFSINRNYPARAKIVKDGGIYIQVLEYSIRQNGKFVIIKIEDSEKTDWRGDKPNIANKVLKISGGSGIVNGWEFWSISKDKKKTLADIRAEYEKGIKNK